MSRSRKKVPYVAIACGERGNKDMKKIMSNCTREWLKNEDNVINGAYVKKYWHSYRWMPSDGKVYRPTIKKAWRK